MAKSICTSQLLLMFDEVQETEIIELPEEQEEEEEDDDDDGEEDEDEEEKDDRHDDNDEAAAEHFMCITLHKRGNNKPQGQWREDQRLRAERMELHLSVKWAVDGLIQEQLSRFDAHYSRAMGLCRLKDMPQLLFPKCRLPLEMAALAWLGHWRPSAILTLLRSLSRSESPVTSQCNHVLSQLIRETRVEEAVLDEEMAEIQATCILHLPFSPVRSQVGNLDSLHSEFQKIYQVLMKAQKLRFRTLELVVKKLLNKRQAAEFLVAFAGIQETIHEFAAYQKQRKGPISVTVKALDAQPDSVAAFQNSKVGRLYNFDAVNEGNDHKTFNLI